MFLIISIFQYVFTITTRNADIRFCRCDFQCPVYEVRPILFNYVPSNFLKCWDNKCFFLFSIRCLYRNDFYAQLKKHWVAENVLLIFWGKWIQIVKIVNVHSDVFNVVGAKTKLKIDNSYTIPRKGKVGVGDIIMLQWRKKRVDQL